MVKQGELAKGAYPEKERENPMTNDERNRFDRLNELLDLQRGIRREDLEWLQSVDGQAAVALLIEILREQDGETDVMLCTVGGEGHRRAAAAHEERRRLTD